MSDPWYPGPEAYYVPALESGNYPLRQGDLVGPIAVDGTMRSLVQVVHPTCELGKKGVDRVQVCVVERLSDLADDFQRSSVAAGMREMDGRFLVAFAHTFYLPGTFPGDEEKFANFRRLHLVEREHIVLAHRDAALTHDARVYFIRRWLYFRFRIYLSFRQVRDLEAERIRDDRAFQGPKPAWAL